MDIQDIQDILVSIIHLVYPCKILINVYHIESWNAESGAGFNKINTDALRNRLVDLGAVVSCDAELDTELVQSSQSWTAEHKAETGHR